MKKMISISFIAMMMFSCGILDKSSLDESKEENAAQWETFSNPNFIYSVVADLQGNIWAAGSGGVLRYDPDAGEFDHYTVDDGLPSNWIDQLVLAPDGTILSRGYGRIVYFEDGLWKPYQSKALEGITVNQFAFDPDGHLWFISSNESVSEYDGSTLTKYDLDPLVGDIVVGPDGVVWVAGTNLMSFDGVNWVQHEYLEGMTGLSILIYQMIVDPEGRIWFSMGGTGRWNKLYRYDGSEWLVYERESFSEWGETESGQVWNLGSMWPDLEEGIWLVGDTQNDLLLTHLSDTQTISQKIPIKELHAEAIRGFAILSSGDIWLGSHGKSTSGLVYGLEGEWSQISYSSDLPSNYISDCSRAPNGDMWFDTSEGLVGFNGSNWITGNGQGEYLMATNLEKDFDGNLWAKTQTSLYLLDNGIWSHYLDIPENTNLLGVVGSEDIWLVSSFLDQTVWHCDRQGCSSFPILLEGYYTINALEVTQDGRVFIGLEHKGLFELDRDTWRFIGSENGGSIQFMDYFDDVLWLSIWDEPIVGPEIWSYDLKSKVMQIHKDIIPSVRHNIETIFFSSDGYLWIGNYFDGVVRYDPLSNSTFLLTPIDGLPSAYISAICQGKGDTIWFGTDSGLSRYQP